MLVAKENSRRHGEHSHWIVACPPPLVAALVEHVQRALLHIDQRDVLPPRTWWWTKPTVVRALPGGTTRRVVAGWTFSEFAVQQGHLPYAAKQLVPPGERIEGVSGTHDRRPPGRRLHFVTRRVPRRPVRFYPDQPDSQAAAPAACQGHDTRPGAVAVKPVAVQPPAPLERPTEGDSSMNSLIFRPVFASEGGPVRQPVMKAGRPPLGFASLVTRVDQLVAGATATPAELADLRRRATAALEAAVGTGKEAAVHFVIRKLDGISASARPVEKAAGRGAVPPVKGAGADDGLPTDAELARMAAEAKRLLARAPESEKPKIAGLLSDIAALRAAVARGPVAKAGGLHPLRRLALARAEAERGPVEKRGAGGGGVHPLRRLAMARAAGGVG